MLPASEFYKRPVCYKYKIINGETQPISFDNYPNMEAAQQEKRKWENLSKENHADVLCQNQILHNINKPETRPGPLSSWLSFLNLC